MDGRQSVMDERPEDSLALAPRGASKFNLQTNIRLGKIAWAICERPAFFLMFGLPWESEGKCMRAHTTPAPSNSTQVARKLSLLDCALRDKSVEKAVDGCGD